MNKPLMYSGFHAVEALLRHRPEAVLELFVQDSRAEREEPRLAAMIQSARDFGIAVQRARREVLEKHAGPQHQGIVARARPRKPGDESGLLKWLDGKPARPWLLILENVTDPITWAPACVVPMRPGWMR
jgi:23S rRNA (guanosine2251-2'-O)-methyltransferase